MKTERMTVAAKLRLHKKLQAPARRRETGNQLAACDEIWQSRDIQHLLDCDKIRQSSDVQHLLHFWRNMAIWWPKTSSSVQTRRKCVSVATQLLGSLCCSCLALYQTLVTVMRLEALVPKRGWSQIISKTQNCFVAKESNKNVKTYYFCNKMLKCSTFVAKLLSYAQWAKKMD